MRIIRETSSLPQLSRQSILANESYLKVKSNHYGWFCDENFVMPFFVDKQLRFFRRLVITLAPIAIKSKQPNLMEYKSFLNEALLFLNDNKWLADYVEKPQANVFFPIYPDKINKLQVIPWGTYLTDLSDATDPITHYHSKHRNVIRKAIKDGVIISTATVDEVYENICSTLKLQHAHAPTKRYYEKLIENIPNNVIFYKATFQKQIEGVAVIVYDKECGYYMYGGSSKRHHIGSINYLQYVIMRDLQRKEVKCYDLVGARVIYEEGSKYDGIQHFKSRFATSNPQGYTFKYIVNPIKYWLFISLVRIYGAFHGFKYSDSIKDTLKLMKERNIRLNE